MKDSKIDNGGRAPGQRQASVVFDQETYDRIEALGKKEGRKFSSMLRRFCATYIDDYEKKAK